VSMPQAEAAICKLFRLDGRVAFLSGAGGWLGRSMAKALASAGAHVILNGRRQEPLETLASEIASSGASSSVACFDITDEPAVRKHVDFIAREHGHLHILVNNASSGRPGTLANVKATDFDEVYRVNVTAAFNLLERSLPLLKKAAQSCESGGSVINIASMYGAVSPDPSLYGNSGMDNPPSYGAAKAGLIQLTRYTACHLAPQRIRVNCISPGPFPSPQVLERDPDFHRRLKVKSPMLRTGSPNELDGPLLFLASDASSYVTGVNLAVDGGWTAW
jgi:NAD(P)-dependent dehydrogenase (short-subunit alcohol dehydrogenase family)